MATATPNVFLTSVRDAKRAEVAAPHHESYRAFRLPPSHAADLRDVARGVEETEAGVCCKYLVDHELSGGDGDAVSLHDLERWCEKFDVWTAPSVASWHARIRRCRLTLSRLAERGEHRTVGILHVVYGYPDPSVRSWPQKAQAYLGELAPLARYTDVVEAKRVELARAEAVRSAARVSNVAPTRWRSGPWEEKDDDGKVVPPSALSGSEDSRRAIRLGLPTRHGAALLDFMRHREIYDQALRATSSADALRAALAAFAEPGPTRREGEPKNEHAGRAEAWAARRDAQAARQEAFLTAVRLDADRMLQDASRGYVEAWRAIGAERSDRFACAPPDRVVSDMTPTMGYRPAPGADGVYRTEARERGPGWSTT